MIRLLQGDITKVPADMIVNAANEDLIGGGGVDGAIHRAGGPEIMRELRGKKTSTGSGVTTSAGNLPAKYVFHAVGPVWRGGGFDEEGLLADAYKAALEAARDLDCKVVTFPSISTGAYGFPVEKAAPIALKTVSLFEGEAVFVLFDKRTFDAYDKARSLLP